MQGPGATAPPVASLGLLAPGCRRTCDGHEPSELSEVHVARTHASEDPNGVANDAAPPPLHAVDAATVDLWRLAALPGGLVEASYLVGPLAAQYRLIVDVLLAQQQHTLTGVAADELRGLVTMPAISTAGSPAMTKLPDACRLRLLVGVRMGAGRESGSATRRGGAGWRTARIRPFGSRSYTKAPARA